MTTSGPTPEAPRAGEPSPVGADPVGYDWSAPQGHRPDPRTLSVGVTHTQYSIDDWGGPPATVSAKAVLTATASYQNQHIFGWGAENPQPSPGRFDWSSLDRRMELIRSTGGTPVITLCCAPDWMKGGRPGETNWDRLHDAPRPQHYADFAALAAAVARRYPDVRHFQVWNEMKGFWNDARNRWDYESYTNLYNTVYDALKAVDPTIAVGGPYVVIDTWARRTTTSHPSALAGACGVVDQRGLDVLDYWLRHKHGADFVAVDAGLSTRDQGRITATTTSSALFGALTRWLRQRTSLPIWWSEFHVGRAEAGGQPKLTARAVAALLHMADQGATTALIWEPQRDTDETHGPALWSSTDGHGGGRPLAYAEAVARLQQVLAGRTGPDTVSWPVPELGLAQGREGVLLVHTEDDRIDLQVQGRPLRLEPYEVRYVALRTDAPVEFAFPVTPRPSAPAVPTGQCLRLTDAAAQPSETR
ncbi:GH39 family glycosyl hydrolase [Micromonospora cremea]|uniref:GH39 family glycosyl hydrolase n=1 Tax=Micromonospora cremea TaxID=709881 RepID=UPI0013567154|nr:hypothetical protein [Micromonospora cremea]